MYAGLFRLYLFSQQYSVCVAVDESRTVHEWLSVLSRLLDSLLVTFSGRFTAHVTIVTQWWMLQTCANTVQQRVRASESVRYRAPEVQRARVSDQCARENTLTTIEANVTDRRLCSDSTGVPASAANPHPGP